MTQFDPSRPAGGAWQFNPPPGWPTPPAGWVPPPNWQPDPSWPPVPPGWPFWVPVGYAPAAAAPPRSNRARWVLAAKLGAGVLTLVATVIAAVIALVDRPEPYTMDDWRTRANATCERDIGAAHLSLLTGMLKVGQLTGGGLPPAGQPDPTMQEAADSLARLGAGLRAVSADLREIQVPDGAPRADIDALINATGDFAGYFESVSTVLVDHQLDRLDDARLRQMRDETDRMATDVRAAWLGAAQRLGLNQCVVVMGLGPGPPPTSGQ